MVHLYALQKFLLFAIFSAAVSLSIVVTRSRNIRAPAPHWESDGPIIGDKEVTQPATSPVGVLPTSLHDPALLRKDPPPPPEPASLREDLSSQPLLVPPTPPLPDVRLHAENSTAAPTVCIGIPWRPRRGSPRFLQDLVHDLLSSPAHASGALHIKRVHVFNALWPRNTLLEAPLAELSKYVAAHRCILTNMTAEFPIFVDRKRPYKDHWGNTAEHVRWTFAVTQAHMRTMQLCIDEGANFTLILEDDVDAADGAIEALLNMTELLRSRSVRWDVIVPYVSENISATHLHHADPFFYEYGAVAMFYHTSFLASLLRYIRENEELGPVDWMMLHYFRRQKSPIYAHVPPLFQHMGIVSTLDSKNHAHKTAHEAYQTPSFKKHGWVLDRV